VSGIGRYGDQYHSQWLSGVTLELFARDAAQVHLVRTVGHPQGAGPGVEVGQREVVAHATGAVDLDRPVDDRAGDPGNHHLDRGNFGTGALGSVVVDQPGSLEHQQPGLLDLQPAVRDLLAHHTLLGQRTAEGDPGGGPGDHRFDGPLGHADQPHAVVDPPWTESGLGDGEPAALLAEQVGHRHPHVVEMDLGVAVLVLVAEHRQVPLDLQAGGVPWHQHHGLLAMRLRLRVGLAHHDEDRAARVGGAGDPPFLAVDHVLVAVP